MIKINDKIINSESPVFLIAEVGVNHNGDISLAKKLIKLAVNANVDAVKFQTFKSEKFMLKSTPKANYQKIKKNSDENFYKMVKKYELSDNEFRFLSEYCKENEITFLSTPFDDSSVELLENLNIPAYKVSSGDMNNFPLLGLICSKKKPILLSTGMSTLNEVRDSINFIKSNGIKEIVIFQCTTNYPTLYEEINLNVIDTYKKEFPNEIIGFSDHSLGIEASIGAVAKGAKVIEKHFTLDKEMEGPDHKTSLDPSELRIWVSSIRNLEKALGSFQKKPLISELEIAKIARKSIVSLKNINKGEILTRDNIGVKRPGNGISPIYFKKFIGKRINKDIQIDSMLSWEDIE